MLIVSSHPRLGRSCRPSPGRIGPGGVVVAGVAAVVGVVETEAAAAGVVASGAVAGTGDAAAAVGGAAAA
jgi:hypothetical protein